MNCNRDNCTCQATCALGMEFYPFESLMKYYGRIAPLSKFITGVYLCNDHFVEAEQGGPDPWLPGEFYDNAVKTVSAVNGGIVVDRKATRVVRIELTDPILKHVEQINQAAN